MSELRVDNIVDMGGSGAPQLRKGANVTGISTITQAVVGNVTINAGGINATGIVTSSSNKFVGDLASGNITAGVMTATSSVVASNITINSGGVNASGIVSATSYTGSGANLSGIGLTIAPLAYNPDVSDHEVSLGTGIGLTFNQRVSAGTGNVTLSLVSVGSTLVENFSVGSSVTYNNDANPPNITINPTADLDTDTVYAISYPSGAFTQSGAGGSFVGTAYTFYTTPVAPKTLWTLGSGGVGQGARNGTTACSSPVQVGSDNDWIGLADHNNIGYQAGATKTDGTIWVWGDGGEGSLGQNDKTHRSSPIQIPGTTWAESTTTLGTKAKFSVGRDNMMSIKTDGTMWGWGENSYGQLGQNNETEYSSPTQIPGTTWQTVAMGRYHTAATKTDGTLWCWGLNHSGQVGDNSAIKRSSPVQVPGTTWARAEVGETFTLATKTDNTLWSWGNNQYGQLGYSPAAEYSSPIQIPGTWATMQASWDGAMGTKTDGTLWAWGENERGELGLNDIIDRSSPVQVGSSTDWSTEAAKLAGEQFGFRGIKTDGTLWGWGDNELGELGQNNRTKYSSPVQIPGTKWVSVACGYDSTILLKDS